MKALMFEQFKQNPVLREIERPTPGPGEVLLKVAGSGACHSDVAVFHDYDGDPTGGKLSPSYALGHEISGWVEESGEGVTGFTPGDAYLVYGPIGCQRCRACSRGQDTYCENVAEMPYLAAGLGRNGGMAEYVVVPARNLVPLGDADPVAAAPLADAGLTPYHAIKRVLPHLNGGGKTALVIGLGGLGMIAVQILKALTGAEVLATDMKPEAVAEAEKFGAIGIPGGAGQVEAIRAIVGARGVDAVFDFVGITPTIETAAAVVARQGALTVVGIAGHPFEWNFYKVPYEVNFSTIYWGTIEDLYELVEMYKKGQVKPAVEVYSLDNAMDAYQKMMDGKLSGRAVIAPHGA